MLAAVLASQSFVPPTRMASAPTRTNGISMEASETRRELLTKVSGAAFALAGVAQSASAKAGQFGKQDVFGFGSAPHPLARARAHSILRRVGSSCTLGIQESGTGVQPSRGWAAVRESNGASALDRVGGGVHFLYPPSPPPGSAHRTAPHPAQLFV